VEKLELVHQKLYEQLSLIDDICRKYKINYYLFYGTLLGAVRESHIIPWDDDVDILMSPNDLERFSEAFAKESPQGYAFGYADLWICRLVPLKDSRVGGTFDLSSISTDFFVLSKVPASRFKHKLRLIGLKALQGAIKPRLSTKKGGALLKAAQVATWMLGQLIPYRFKLKIYNHLRDFFSDGSGGYYVGNGEYRYLELVYSKSAFQDQKRLQLGNLALPVMVGYDEVLMKTYGDYMTPPPPKERLQFHLKTDKRWVLNDK